jgi:RND family efflux transporter MFP subunit
VEIPVNTIRPTKKTLERTLTQPGSIVPSAEAELYAKTSGYLKYIQRDMKPELLRSFISRGGEPMDLSVMSAFRLMTAIHLAVLKLPEKDIGSRVFAGEVLLEIATPERLQDIVEKESLLLQRLAELEAARSALTTSQASVDVAKAQKVQAEAEVRKCEFEHSFKTKELIRRKELAKSGAVTPQVVEEKQNEVDAALAACESSRAKVQTVEAELRVAEAKFAAVSTDIRVKELLVQVARDGLRQAQILADYSNVRAPFDGIITHRSVDEGDFIQNATSGQTRRLMTVVAIDTVKVVIQIPERDTPWVHVGSEATVALDAWRGRDVKGRVARVSNALDPETRTMRAEIDLENPDHRLLPGMYGQVTLALQRISNAMVIPATALYSRKGENFIILVRDGAAHRQLVRVRYDDGREVEVVKLIDGQEVALNESDEVVISNKGEIAEGQHVRSTRADN